MHGVKSLELAPGLANARTPGSAKFANAPLPGADKAGKCPEVARGGGGDWAQLELTDALLPFRAGFFVDGACLFLLRL